MSIYLLFQMKYFSGQHYVWVKEHRYLIQLIEKFLLGLRGPPTSLRTQYQVQNDTQIRKNQKVNRNDNNELVAKIYPKINQPVLQQPECKPPNCRSCKRKKMVKI